LLKALAGVRGAYIRVRPATSERSIQPAHATRFHRRSVGAARRLIERLSAASGAGLRSERVVPIGVALIVLLASIVSFQPPTAVGSAAAADAESVRIAVGGLNGAGVVEGQPYDEMEVRALLGRGGAAGDASRSGGSIAPAVDDGTLYKPVIVDTTVVDGKALLRQYVVQSGDTLIGIAEEAGVSMMTLWWANKLASKDDLHVGQTLIVPPVSGLVVTVAEGDTLDGLAAKYNIDADQVVAVNRLEDTNLVINQVLILPDAVGAPIPTPKPVAVRPCNCGGGGAVYTGGRFGWPVVGGNNYISQYYHYGHYAIDIAATYGSAVVAAAGGTVVFAGWKNNGGGYQVWLAHGGNLYTAYYHMSAIVVGNGQAVGRGQQVGRIGSSGWATGPHLHFEVWIGPVTQGSRVNPLGYY